MYVKKSLEISWIFVYKYKMSTSNFVQRSLDHCAVFYHRQDNRRLDHHWNFHACLSFYHDQPWVLADIRYFPSNYAVFSLLFRMEVSPWGEKEYLSPKAPARGGMRDSTTREYWTISLQFRIKLDLPSDISRFKERISGHSQIRNEYGRTFWNKN